MFHYVKNLIQSLFRDDQLSEAKVPDGVRLYAVGDIHGRDDLLEQLLTKIEKDAASKTAATNVIVFLGDYVDRGLQSREVLNRLIAGPPTGFEAVYLKGNHEEALLQFLVDAQFAKTWKYYGGLETLHSYNVTELTLSDDPVAFERARDKFETVLPSDHRAFLEKLSISTTFGDYFFAHAGVRPGIGLGRQSEHDLMWIRDDFLSSRANFGKIVVHGHTPREAVEFRPNRIGIDTGAYMTNVLTALVLEGSERVLLQTDG
ncbi:MAG: metallophosphoesterase [Rhodobiaceae bacterium]|nr:MAG: metallophosphoesterase [Rhodobiaceae bacterium]